jgi:hypothetical protein
VGPSMGFCLRSLTTRQSVGVDPVKTVVRSFAQILALALLADHRRGQVARPAFDPCRLSGIHRRYMPLGRFVHPREVAARLPSCRILPGRLGRRETAGELFTATPVR